MEFIIGIILVIVIAVWIAIRNGAKNKNTEINSTVLPLPPKPPRDTP